MRTYIKPTLCLHRVPQPGSLLLASGPVATPKVNDYQPQDDLTVGDDTKWD